MISIGGINTHMGDETWTDKDPFAQGLGIFDMTELTWKLKYDHEAEPYEMPKSVEKFYTDK